jgi:thiamine-phosphate pyrophosphorylase
MPTAPPEPATPRLYLVTPAVAEPSGFAATLDAALRAGDVAAVLLRLAEAGERTLIERVKALAPVVQSKAVALLLDGHPGLVARAGADGAHVGDADALAAALAALKPDRIVGAGGLGTRHDAMSAAEAGADYVMFGEPDANNRRPSFAAVCDRVEWWAEVFEVPCVGFAADLDEVPMLVRAGADFVALGDGVWTDARGAATFVAAAGRRLAEPVG